MMAGTRAAWDETDDSRLWTLLAEGLSSREIGERMGRTKGAVIARVHRRGWRFSRDPIGGPLRIIRSGKYAASPKSRTAPVVVPPPPPAPTQAIPPPEALPPVAVSSLVAYTPPAVFSHCQWTDSGRRPWVFCDAPVAHVGCPYCLPHMRRAWQVPPKWRTAA